MKEDKPKFNALMRLDIPKRTTKLKPLFVADTRLDTIFGWGGVVLAIIATLGWLVPEIMSWSVWGHFPRLLGFCERLLD